MVKFSSEFRDKVVLEDLSGRGGSINTKFGVCCDKSFHRRERNEFKVRTLFPPD